MIMKSTLKKLFIAVPALMLLFSGCGPHVYVKDVDNTTRPPNAGQLDIYASPDEVKRPYQTIKTMRVEDKRVEKNQNEEQMKQRAMDRAKKAGADAIIITNTGIHRYRVRDGMGGSVLYNSRFIELEAIVYSDK